MRDLSQLLDETEAKAWKSLRRHRFVEFGVYAEHWALLHQASGEKRRNPFSAVAAVGRRHKQ